MSQTYQNDEYSNDSPLDNTEEIFQEILNQFMAIKSEVDSGTSNTQSKVINFNFRVYYLLKNTIALCQNLLEENLHFKKVIEKYESQQKLTQRLFIENQENEAKYNDLLTEFNNLQEENEQLIKQRVICEDTERKINTELKFLTEQYNKCEQNLRINDIEKEEMFNKCENLENNYELEMKKANKYRKLLMEKEKEIKNLNRNFEDVNEKFNTLTSFSQNNFIQNEQETYCSNYSNSVVNNSKSNTIPNVEGCLNSICPELDDDDQESIDNQINLVVTPVDVIRRMSKTEKTLIQNSSNKDLNFNYLSTQSSKTNLSNPPDIYKEFFLLTFQSFKLNAEDIDLFLEINTEYLYKKIQTENIPFHKFYQYIEEEIHKKKCEQFSLFVSG